MPIDWSQQIHPRRGRTTTHASFKKEKITKMWFEWNENWGARELEVEVAECGNEFLESPRC
ncbi:hypothetical protein CDL15_Pgr004277 [Punica granatum]|uniref:Uncharacterized protein n=1 Tax=Punica granatum TaxID=22663 RepID=A0A218XGJ1_PUNGR|nr:hypothetical protein CDL15_Pgr004277 [Punica granatum]